jgi:predicted Zn-dependent protease
MTAELELAAKVLELVRTAAGPGGQAEVTVSRQALALTRFANSFIHQNLADDTTTVGLRLHAGGRTVAGSSTVTGPDGLRDLVERTIQAARHAPADPGWPGLAPPAPPAGEPGFDEATAAAPPDARALRVAEFVAAAGGLETAGYCRTAHWSTGYANSAGQVASGQTSEAAIDGTARRGGADGVARCASARLADLHGNLLGARAAAKAHAGADPVELPPGDYEVVLEPPAVADMLQHLAFWAFNGKAHAEGRSFAEPGTAQFDRSVTLLEDPFGGGPGWAVDAEGTPTQRLTLVDAGVTTAVAHDRRTAAQLGGPACSTGHGLPDSTAGPFPHHLGLVPTPGRVIRSDAVVDPGAAELASRVERGLLVSDLFYTRPLDPKTLAVTGLTRNGVWLIERGEVTRPVRNLRFTQSYPQALAPGMVHGVGPAATVLPADLIVVASCWVRAPALHLASWHFTGGACG